MTAIASSGALGSASGATAGIPVPSGVVSGSKVIVYTFAAWNSSTTRTTAADMTPPAGFTAGGSRGQLVFANNWYWLAAWWWKDATGSDAGTYSFTAPGAASIGGYAFRVTSTTGTGVSPFVDTFQGNGADASSSTTVASFTPGANDSLLLGAITSGGTVTSTGWTSVGQAVAADTSTMGVLSLSQTTAAALNPTFTGGDGYIHVLIATLRGSGGGADGTVAAVVATATAAAPIPVVAGSGSDGTVNAVVATATAQAEVPAVSGEIVVTGGGPATATVQAHAPVVTGENGASDGSVVAVVATATALAPAPVVTGDASVSAPAATATATAPAPSIAGIQSVTVLAVQASAALNALAPTVSGTNYYFTPPTVKQPIAVGHRLLSRYSLDAGQSVLLRNGTYEVTPFPWIGELEGLTEGTDYFMGGRTYAISAEVATALAGDGFEVDAL